MSDLLDQLPLSVLLALQEIAADPSEAGRARAAARAAEAGFHLELGGEDLVLRPVESTPRVDPVPIPMQPATTEPGTVFEELRFEEPRFDEGEPTPGQSSSSKS